MFKATVFVVDDEPKTRQRVAAVATAMNCRVETYGSAEEFLQRHNTSDPGCIVMDLQLPGMSGLELHERLQANHCPHPVIAFSACVSIPMTVKTMKNGAITVLEKPSADHDLEDAIREGLAVSQRRNQELRRREERRLRLARLSDSEREVMNLIMLGRANKLISHELRLSLRTVELRRHQIFSKTETSSVAELVRFVIEAQ